MDLDGDGIGDILSGSYDGDLYFFKGQGKGEFAAPVKLQREGKAINLGASSTVFAVDWRGTGRLDLLVGNMPGDLYLIPNDGTNAMPAYGAPRKLEAGGQPIRGPHHGDAQPVAADWDGDGLLDLIVVNNARSKITILYNQTGKTNLAEKANLSEEDKKLEQAANRKIQELQMKMQPFYDEYAKRLKAPTAGDKSAQDKRERQKKAQEVLNQKEFQELQKEMQQVTESMRKFRRPAQHQGHVWLYLRKPAVAAN